MFLALCGCCMPPALSTLHLYGLCPVAVCSRLVGPGLMAPSSLQKDASQSPWAETQRPVPRKDSDASLSERPPGDEPAQSSLSTEEAGASAKDPDSPGASPLSPSNGDQAQPVPVVKPGTSA